jgi:GNAT superfamily N-acetyltransferase
VVREATEADAGALADLLTQLGYPTTPEQARSRLQRILPDAAWATLLFEERGRILGFGGIRVSASYEHDTPVAQIVAMVIDAGMRRHGVGAELVAALERRAASMGAAKIVVTSANRRADAHAFYEKLGYARTGLRFGKELCIVLLGLALVAGSSCLGGHRSLHVRGKIQPASLQCQLVVLDSSNQALCNLPISGEFDQEVVLLPPFFSPIQIDVRCSGLVAVSKRLPNRFTKEVDLGIIVSTSASRRSRAQTRC